MQTGVYSDDDFRAFSWRRRSEGNFRSVVPGSPSAPVFWWRGREEPGMSISDRQALPAKERSEAFRKTW